MLLFRTNDLFRLTIGLCSNFVSFPTDMHSFPAPIIHRDLKSLNVLIGEGAGGAMVAKVRASVLPFACAGDTLD